MDPVSQALLQYGAIGLLALIATTFAYKLLAALQAAFEREKQRADRLEADLRELNSLINERLAGELVRAREATGEMVAFVRNQRRQ